MSREVIWLELTPKIIGKYGYRMKQLPFYIEFADSITPFEKASRSGRIRSALIKAMESEHGVQSDSQLQKLLQTV